MICKMESAKK